MAKITLVEFLKHGFGDRKFEVYSIASGNALSTPASFNATCDELDKLGDINGASNGMDMREVK